ncbi:MAG: hypothetical protein AAB538_06040 [Patescibacteria group bacterium]
MSIYYLFAFAMFQGIMVPVSEPPTNVEVELQANPSFITIPASVSLPDLNVTFRERTIKNIGNTVLEEQKGVVTNASSLDWQFVEVAGIAVGNSGAVVGIGKTFVGDLKVGQQREFTLSWPATREPIRNVIPDATTNIYREENIVRVLGDPGLLR